MNSFQQIYYSHFYAHDEHDLPVPFRYELSIHTLYMSSVLSWVIRIGDFHCLLYLLFHYSWMDYLTIF